MNLWPGIHVAKLMDDIDGNGHPGRDARPGGAGMAAPIETAPTSRA
jgi:hypothetical protein